MRRALPLWLAAALVSAALAAGCGGKSKKGDTTAGGGGGASGAGGAGVTQDFSPIEMSTLCNTKVDLGPCDTRKNEVAPPFDLNNDGHPDLWRVLGKKDDGSKYTACKLVNLDFDRKPVAGGKQVGTIDYLVVYSPDGYVLAEQFDFDYDNVMDAQFRYDAQKRVRFLAERDSNGDGAWDVCEEYDDVGQLMKIQRDRNADGKPDQWELYQDGNVTAILYDNDGDGRVDDRDEAPRAQAAGPATPPPAEEPKPEAPAPSPEPKKKKKQK